MKKVKDISSLVAIILSILSITFVSGMYAKTALSNEKEIEELQRKCLVYEKGISTAINKAYDAEEWAKKSIESDEKINRFINEIKEDIAGLKSDMKNNKENWNWLRDQINQE